MSRLILPINIQFIDLANPLWSKTLEQLRQDFYHLPGYVGLEAKRIDAITEAISIADSEKIFFSLFSAKLQEFISRNGRSF